MPPASGDPLFIDPRQEDVLQLFMLDLSHFLFAAHPRLTGRQRDRAKYTLKTLRLNADPLCVQRGKEYGNCLARLKVYRNEKQQGAAAQMLERSRAAILNMSIPTVFREMQRQQAKIPELRDLFGQIPEALTW